MDLDAGQAGDYWFQFHTIILTERLRSHRACVARRCAADNSAYKKERSRH
jgi:hypothetical protein